MHCLCRNAPTVKVILNVQLAVARATSSASVLDGQMVTQGVPHAVEH